MTRSLPAACLLVLVLVPTGGCLLFRDTGSLTRDDADGGSSGPTADTCSITLSGTSGAGKCPAAPSGVVNGKKIEQGTGATLIPGDAVCGAVSINETEKFTILAPLDGCITIEFASSTATLSVTGTKVNFTMGPGDTTKDLEAAAKDTLSIAITTTTFDTYKLSVQ